MSLDWYLLFLSRAEVVCYSPLFTSGLVDILENAIGVVSISAVDWLDIQQEPWLG